MIMFHMEEDMSRDSASFGTLHAINMRSRVIRIIFILRLVNKCLEKNTIYFLYNSVYRKADICFYYYIDISF